MKILVITDFIVYPPQSGAQVRIFGLISHLCKRHKVVLFAPARRAVDAEGITHLESMGIKVETVHKPAKRNLPKAVWARVKAFFSSIPAYWVLTNDEAIEKAIAEAIEKHKPDVIQIEYLNNCRYLKSFSGDAPLVLDEYDIVGDREIGVARAMGKSVKARLYGREAKKVLDFEKKMFAKMDLVIACSEVDQAYFKKMVPGARTAMIPNGVELGNYAIAGPVDDHSLVLTGSLDCVPNIEAAMDLAHEILPRVRKAVPDVKTKIVGRNPGPEVRALASDGLEVIPSVPDIRPYIAEAAVVVVPIRTGGGTRIKILEAMASGKAIVSTSKGAEGLNVRDGHDIILRDDHDGFAQAVVDLLTNPEKRAELGRNARATVEAQYGYEALASRLEKELSTLKTGDCP